jgi:glycosyltransferase involved in cell wall biosynthesis
MGAGDPVSDLPRTLFVSRAGGGVAWYRCAVPALALGAEWVGLAGDPPDVSFVTGLTAEPLTFEEFAGYDVVVVQQPSTPAWRRAITDLQRAGVVVLFEIDDYIQAVRKIKTHESRAYFDEPTIKAAELNMRLCDGIICSTPYLERRYRAFNRNVWVCRNGLDLQRYTLERPVRDGVTIGWAGGVGHRDAVGPWLDAVRDVLRRRPQARFVTVGRAFADELVHEFGAQRCLAIPYSPLEAYPAAMTLFDIALAPSADDGLFRGKSDLRWLESGAMGIPLIADPRVYADIEPDVTGVHARNPAEAKAALLRLIDDPVLRARIGAAARDHVRTHRSAQAVAPQWERALREAVALRAVAGAA